MTDMFDFAAQVVAGLAGVGGGLMVYAVGQRHARDQEVQERSVRAAGALLAAVHAYAIERDAPLPPTDRDPTVVDTWGSARAWRRQKMEQDAHRRLRVEISVHLPQLKDHESRAALRSYADFVAHWGLRHPDPPDLDGEEAEEYSRLRHEERDALEAEAERALSDYLRRQAGI